MAQNQAKTQVVYETGHGEVCTTLMPDGQLWPFLRMRNCKLGKNSRSELGDLDVVPLPKLNIEKNESCKTLLIKWLSNVRRNDFVVNNSL